MRVQRVLMPGSEAESWTLLGDDQVPVEPVERFLAYLASVEKSPNTVKAYAHDLKDWFTYPDRSPARLADGDAGGRRRLRGVAPAARRRAVRGRSPYCPPWRIIAAAASVNRKLAALVSFCEFHARHGVALAGLLVTMQPAGRGGSATSFKPFLHHISQGRAAAAADDQAEGVPAPAEGADRDRGAGDPGRLRPPARSPAVCAFAGFRGPDRRGSRPAARGYGDRRADRDRHAAAQRQRGPGQGGYLPDHPGQRRADAAVCRLPHPRVRRRWIRTTCSSTLWSQPHGRPWAYAAVYDLVLRLRERTGIDFEPHQFRHTYATWLLRRGAGMETVKECSATL